VSCERTHTVLHGYLDGELDAVRAQEFERHLEDCQECVAELEAQESLRSLLGRAPLYEKAPESLCEKVVADLGGSVVARRERRFPGLYRRGLALRLLLATAAALLGAFASWYVLRIAGSGSGGGGALAAQVVDAHLRALQPGHLTDVASTDQHTVKPWFDGKLDFAPPVRDLAEQGFPLAGGRLDVLNGRSVAVLVYGRRQHVVNVFVWPDAGRDSQPVAGATLGYNWIKWRKDGMQMWAVSDLNAAELSELGRLLQ
jgi:mycothiol system anti-sigma-R factor